MQDEANFELEKQADEFEFLLENNTDRNVSLTKFFVTSETKILSLFTNALTQSQIIYEVATAKNF